MCSWIWSGKGSNREVVQNYCSFEKSRVGKKCPCSQLWPLFDSHLTLSRAIPNDTFKNVLKEQTYSSQLDTEGILLRERLWVDEPIHHQLYNCRGIDCDCNFDFWLACPLCHLTIPKINTGFRLFTQFDMLPKAGYSTTKPTPVLLSQLQY